MVARTDLWDKGELKFYRIADTASSLGQAKKQIFKTPEDLEKIKFLKRN